MEKKEQKSFDSLIKELKDYIETLNDTIEVLTEIVRIQHNIIQEDAKDSDKNFWNEIGKLLY